MIKYKTVKFEVKEDYNSKSLTAIKGYTFVLAVPVEYDASLITLADIDLDHMIHIKYIE